jgi:hypothetical protein
MIFMIPRTERSNNPKQINFVRDQKSRSSSFFNAMLINQVLWGIPPRKAKQNKTRKLISRKAKSNFMETESPDHRPPHLMPCMRRRKGDSKFEREDLETGKRESQEAFFGRGPRSITEMGGRRIPSRDHNEVTPKPKQSRPDTVEQSQAP